MQIDQAPPPPAPHPLLAYPFRPFFLLTALYAVVAIAGWLGAFFANWAVTGPLSPLRWHAHEMLFGWTTAAIAGFLLTAICNWTGCRPLTGWRLGILIGVWLAGRAAMWLSGTLPALLVTVLDLGFLATLAGYVARVIIATDNRRNLGIVAILALLFGANLMMHLGFIHADHALALTGERVAINLILLLIVVIGGRITPLFTANWLARQGGESSAVRGNVIVDRLAILTTALMLPIDWIAAGPWPGAVIALLAAAVNSVRLAGWSGWRSARDPLVWILHLGYGWVVVALWLKGLTPAVEALTAAVWLHAAGVGAMGTMILGVMTRVSLGHTGRPLALPRGAASIYVAVTLAVLFRLIAAFGWVDYRATILLSGAAWVAAFTLFLVFYWSILSRPRVDGRPG